MDQLCWHPSHPDLLATASGDKSVRIWDGRQSKCAANIHTKGENINIDWAPDGKTIAVGNKEDLVTFIDAKTHKVSKEHVCAIYSTYLFDFVSRSASRSSFASK